MPFPASSLFYRWDIGDTKLKTTAYSDSQVHMSDFFNINTNFKHDGWTINNITYKKQMCKSDVK